MLVRGAGGWTPAPARRAGGGGRPRRPRPRRARGARGGRRARVRAGRARRSPLGIEALPAAEAEPLLAAYHDGVAALPAPFRAWAAVGLAAPDPAALAGLLDRGFAGACVAADALAGPAGYEHLGPVLETLERRDAPLLIHPGPVPVAARRRRAALVGGARRLHGGDADRVVRVRRLGPARAPAAARVLRDARRPRAAAPRAAAGPRRRGRARPRRVPRRLVLRARGAIDAVLREIGVDQLVFGSDRPVVAARDLSLGDAVLRRAARAQPDRACSAPMSMEMAV